ncbi:hypothetical protein [Paractinoplanes atraurantiacus]|uniref:hypothetical protein n=1 Tax=Paractinoplanes atraurantiacus TaxID=1036182 RepID=UPI0015CF29A9
MLLGASADRPALLAAGHASQPGRDSGQELTHEAERGSELSARYEVVGMQRNSRPDLDVLPVDGANPREPGPSTDAVGSDVRRPVLVDAASVVASAPIGVWRFGAA